MSPLHQGNVCGHAAVYLENRLLRVTVLPEKGADIYEIVHVPSSIDCLMKTPAALKPPGSGPQSAFLDNYEGGWQELFPSGNDACEYQGRAIPFHGEAALLPWRSNILRNDGAPCLELSTETTILPFRLVKTLQLSASEPVLEVVQSVENTGVEPLHFSWGQHIVLGAPFLEAGCRLEIASGSILTGDDLFEPATASLAPGQREPWPYAAGRHGEQVDLRRVPGPEARTHDDVFLGELSRGHVDVTNPRLGMSVDLDWDSDFYRYLALWMPYGGSDEPPLTGIYGLGIEPFVSRDPLAGAVAAGEARLLSPSEIQRTVLRFRFGPLGPTVH